MVITEVPPLDTISPVSSTPLPFSAMSWPVDCGFIEWITTGPAEAVAEDLTNASPLSATSISITCPSTALEAAEDAADEIAEEAPDGIDRDDEPPDDDPHPAATATNTSAAKAARRALVASMWRVYPQRAIVPTAGRTGSSVVSG